MCLITDKILAKNRLPKKPCNIPGSIVAALSKAAMIGSDIRSAAKTQHHGLSVIRFRFWAFCDSLDVVEGFGFYW